jgi:hypothetical protein
MYICIMRNDFVPIWWILFIFVFIMKCGFGPIKLAFTSSLYKPRLSRITNEQNPPYRNKIVSHNTNIHDWLIFWLAKCGIKHVIYIKHPFRVNLCGHANGFHLWIKCLLSHISTLAIHYSYVAVKLAVCIQTFYCPSSEYETISFLS